jgi:dTDP-4-amino-4,6-dideoxygalactose transaminase
MNALEARLTDAIGRPHGVLAWRASTAMLALFRVLRSEQRTRIVMPSCLCTFPATMALRARCQILWCDMAADGFQMCPDSLSALLIKNQDVAAVVAVHSYGWACNILRISNICRQHGVFCIEDVAQAQGLMIEGQPAGSFGDASVFSFGHSKLLDVGVGGAVLIDDDALAEALRAELSAMPEPSAELENRAADYRRQYYALQARRVAGEDTCHEFTNFLADFTDLSEVRSCGDWPDRVLLVWEQLPERLNQRQRNAALLAHELDALPGILLPPAADSSAPWRFPLRLGKSQAQRVTSALRAVGHDASNWYPSLAHLCGAGASNELKGSLALHEGIVNLWLDPGQTPQRMREAAAVVREQVGLAAGISPANLILK